MASVYCVLLSRALCDPLLWRDNRARCEKLASGRETSIGQVHTIGYHMPSSVTDQEIGAAVKPPIADCRLLLPCATGPRTRSRWQGTALVGRASMLTFADIARRRPRWISHTATVPAREPKELVIAGGAEEPRQKPRL